MSSATASPAGVIYFPYINVPDTPWFARVLLYWDDVACIIPPEYEATRRPGDPRDARSWHRRRSPVERFALTTQLIEAGLLRVVSPDVDGAATAKFVNAFLKRIDSDAQIPKGRAILDLRSSMPVSVHRGKLGSWLLGELERRGLADRRIGGPWIAVERRTATLYMAALAAFLGDSQPHRLRPITNDDESLETLRAVAEPVETDGFAELRETVLEGVLPGPSALEDAVGEISRFKERNDSKLRSFRRRIEREVRDLGRIRDDAERAVRVRDVQSDLEEEIEDLTARMREQGWRDVTHGSLGALAVLAPLGAAAITGEPLAALASVPALAETAFDLLRPSGQLGDETLAYAAIARRAWGLPQG